MKKKCFPVASLLLCVVFNIGAFVAVVDYNTLFWINYMFAMLSMVINIFITICSDNEKKEKMVLSYDLLSVSYVYVFFALLAAFVFSFFDETNAVIPFVVQLVLHTIFIILLYSASSTNRFIKEEQQRRNININKFKMILSRFQEIQDKLEYSSQYRKIFMKTYDILSSSQVDTSANSEVNVDELEKSILHDIDELRCAYEKNDGDSVCMICRQIEEKAVKRDNMIKLRNNF